MAESDPIVPPADIDRTPYGACVGVAAVVLVLFFLAIAGLWKAAGWTKRHGLSFDFNSSAASSASTAASDAAKQALDTAKQAAGDQVKQAADEAVQSAADSAKQAAQDQVNQAAQSVGDSMKKALQ
jgi:hypothetical protein